MEHSVQNVQDSQETYGFKIEEVVMGQLCETRTWIKHLTQALLDLKSAILQKMTTFDADMQKI